MDCNIFNCIVMEFIIEKIVDIREEKLYNFVQKKSLLF